MLGSQTLEVGIGIVFVYLLLGLICSVLNEWIAGVLAMRSKNLEVGIRNLLNDPSGLSLAKQLYDHPLIKGLSKENERPSYVPARLFTLALLDTIAPADAAGPKSFQEVRNAISALQDAHMKAILLTLIDEAGNDLKKARESIENWFNDAMDRVSGWYKRKAHVVILVLALVLTIAVNADTIFIANSLANDATMRAALVAIAERTAKEPLPSGTEPTATMIKQVTTEFQQLELPIGWSLDTKDRRHPPTDFRGWFLKILGLVFTAVAVSLGAPFWFDVLSKLINVRAVGKQPEKIGEKAAA